MSDWDNLVEPTRVAIGALLREGDGMADRIKQLEAANKRLRLEVAHANDTADTAIEQTKEWEAVLQHQTHLIEQLFALLDKREETDDGRVFHPNELRSCRAADTEKLNKILAELRSQMKVQNEGWKCPINSPNCEQNCGNYGCGN